LFGERGWGGFWLFGLPGVVCAGRRGAWPVGVRCWCLSFGGVVVVVCGEGMLAYALVGWVLVCFLSGCGGRVGSGSVGLSELFRPVFVFR